ncbi:MAG: hypothetical protein IJJ41_04710, partial [Clostridia bacterium]|nr:hypothetical protein [Clostridia bacterium]
MHLIAGILCVLQKKMRVKCPINIVFLFVAIPYYHHHGDERISTGIKKYHKHAAALDRLNNGQPKIKGQKRNCSLRCLI